MGPNEIRPDRVKHPLSLWSTVSKPGYSSGRISRFIHHLNIFLCGKDEYSGKNYYHRRQWVEDEILRLSGVFSLEVAAYSVMSNHYHIILYIELGSARGWIDEEVIDR